MENFSYKPIDIEGLDTLNALANADKFNKWTYQTISPYCKGKVLEIGSGIGNISKFFLLDKKDIYLSDLRENYIDSLKTTFSSPTQQTTVYQLDLVDVDFDSKYQHLFETFDTVFALNVVEHIKDHEVAISNCKKLLKKDGHLIILVPAYQLLYNQFDKNLEHYRRYTKKSLAKIFNANSLQITKQIYFNFIGIFGWFVSGKLRKKDIIPANEIKLYNRLVPVFKIIDKIILKRIGLSVITIGKKL